jgi:glycosyltransferase involved in cell wall biosynthesis
VIPAFNEEQTVGSVIHHTRRVLEKSGFSFEIIVVDDGSDDDTALVCEKYKVRVIKNGHRMGKGTALRTGFYACGGDVIVTLDADGCFMPEDIPRLLKPLSRDGFDVSIGLRVFSLGRSPMVKFRMLGNLIYSYFISLFARKKISDSQCGFRAFKAEVVKVMELSSRRFDIESEMLIKAIKNGFRVVEVPVTVRDALGSSNVNVFVDGFLIFWKTLLGVLLPS